MAEIKKYYAMDESLLQYGQEGGESNPNATTMQDMQEYMKQNGDTVANLVSTYLWQPQTAYEVNAEVHSPNLPAGYFAICTTAGTTGELEPDWSEATYDTYEDGSCVWKISPPLSAQKVDKTTYNSDLPLKADLSALQALAGTSEIVASGDNYIRYANGVQICFSTYTKTSNDIVTHPQPFKEGTIPCIQLTMTGSYGEFAVFSEGSVTSFKIKIWRGTSEYTASSRTFRYFAIGWWK